METREAREDEIPYLRERLSRADMEQIDLGKARVWVAVEDGKIIGFVSLRLAWQMEPLYIFPECKAKMTRRRAIHSLYGAAQTWFADRTRNRSGIYWMFAITRSREVARWMAQMGWHRQYKGAATHIRYF